MVFKRSSNSRFFVNNNREVLIYAISLFLVTFAVRAVNNMVGTTTPLLAKYGFSFSNALVGVLTSIVAAVNLLSIILINARLPSRLRRAFLFLVNDHLIHETHTRFNMDD